MIKQHKWAAILSSVAILIPALFGVIVWNQLPEQMITHWGFDGTADALSARAWAVFALPLLLLAIHWLCLLVSTKIGQPVGQSQKVISIAFWIIPVISLLTNGFTYAFAFGMEFNPLIFLFSIIGFAFIFIGNYMPKTKQNATMGIKIKWVYTSEENWNQTHRLAGKLWVIIGLLCLPASFLPMNISLILLPILLAVAVIVPTVYSYIYYKKERDAGKLHPIDKGTPEYQRTKRYVIGSLIGVVVLLAVITVVCFTGNITPQYDAESFTLKASYSNNLTLKYTDIDTVEYRESIPEATRVMGYGSPRLSLGSFRCDEFGNHTRYTYTQCDAGIVLTVDGKIIVINQADAAATKALYEELLTRSGR